MLAPRLVIPRHIDVETWCAQLVDGLQIDAGKLRNAQEWRRWGDAFAGLPEVTQYQIPSPNYYKTWQEWADAVWLTIEPVGQ